MKGSQTTSHKMRLKDQRIQRRRLVVAGLCSLIIISYAGLGFTSTHQGIEINTFTILGNATVSTQSLEATVQKSLRVTRGFVLYGGTLFTYDKEGIIRTILQQHPTIKTVEVKATDMHTLQLSVTERVAVAQWCDEQSETQACYVLDEDGFIFSKLKKKDDVLVEYNGIIEGMPLRHKLFKGDFARIHAFIQNINLDFDAVLQKVSVNEDELFIHSKNQPLLKVKIQDNFDTVLSYIKITINSQEYKDFADEEGRNPEYIDLRFGNRVYYK